MASFLRCHAGEYHPITTTAPTGGYTAGTLYKVNDCWTQAFATYAAGASAVMIVEAERTLVAKAAGTGLSINVCDRVYVDTTTKQVYSTNASGRECVGFCTKAAGATDTTVEIALRGHESADLA